MKLSSAVIAGKLLLPIHALARETPPFTELKRVGFTMGSIVTVTGYCQDRARFDHAVDAAFGEMKSIDRLMSVFDSGSELSRVNLAAGISELRVDDRLIEVVRDAAEFTALTAGAFDITVEPLMELYGFRDEKPVHRFPSDAEIARALDSVGMCNVTIDPERSLLGLNHPGSEIDLGGIAVGFAIDRAVRILRSNGIESALINHSGDIYALGSPPDEETWEIGITDPLDTGRIATTVRIRDEALSTSGNYRNFIESGGRTIGHILNPRDGRSADSTLSVTAIAPRAVEADALSTGLFVLGAEKSIPLIRRLPHTRLVAISRGPGGESIVRF